MKSVAGKRHSWCKKGQVLSRDVVNSGLRLTREAQLHLKHLGHIKEHVQEERANIKFTQSFYWIASNWSHSAALSPLECG